MHKLPKDQLIKELETASAKDVKEASPAHVSGKHNFAKVEFRALLKSHICIALSP